ncbi:hypothetical protein BDV96DRAFT_601715 [Lophiotrema nucula]|uniref:C3H1-type domain-containing protein n=1 Tax=Lophiotrema nucula TaxID=690887 RepID=A0A6A5Z1E8_9PLEO|nr:hypothetical protein BDV96DRAFT_601715 [Lophiotrema nucula]
MAICRFFLEGRCLKGPQCTFEHPVQVTDYRAPSNPAPQTATGNAAPSTVRVAERAKTPCAFYQRGSCNKGVSCQFLHEGIVETPPSSEVSRSETICKFFLKNACSKGDACPYKHSFDTLFG